MNGAVSAALIALAVASMVIGAVLAYGQRDIKRLFAYSSVSQIGYIALGLGLATPLSIFGALFYLINHSAAKSLFFLNSGSIEEITGTRDLEKIRGVIASSPVTGYTTLVGALSIAGIPPFGGFWSKLIIIFACIEAGHPWLALAAASVSVMTLGYYFKALTPALFGAPAVAAERDGRTAAAERVSALALAAIVIMSVALLLPNGANALLKSAASVLSDGAAYARTFSGAIR
jgi:multicomponent Na+:H+ antiporter subunit D